MCGCCGGASAKPIPSNVSKPRSSSSFYRWWGPSATARHARTPIIRRVVPPRFFFFFWPRCLRSPSSVAQVTALLPLPQRIGYGALLPSLFYSQYVFVRLRAWRQCHLHISLILCSLAVSLPVPVGKSPWAPAAFRDVAIHAIDAAGTRVDFHTGRHAKRLRRGRQASSTMSGSGSSSSVSTFRRCQLQHLLAGAPGRSCACASRLPSESLNNKAKVSSSCVGGKRSSSYQMKSHVTHVQDRDELDEPTFLTENPAPIGRRAIPPSRGRPTSGKAPGLVQG